MKTKKGSLGFLLSRFFFVILQKQKRRKYDLLIIM